jgi:hypothetical protein
MKADAGHAGLGELAIIIDRLGGIYRTTMIELAVLAEAAGANLDRRLAPDLRGIIAEIDQLRAQLIERLQLVGAGEIRHPGRRGEG